MIIKFSDNDNEKIGNKAKFLIDMKSNGFNVPNGLVLDSDTYTEIIKYNKISEKIDNNLKKLKKENIKSTSKNILNLFEKVRIPSKILEEIFENIDLNKKYAVRSSGTKEDLDNFSFAGQYETFLNISGKNQIEQAIIDCYKSMFSEVLLGYLINNNIALSNLKMSVIVQEMVNSDYSGICFTVNPITGEDKCMLIEVAKGLGENIVSGKVAPEQYSYNWYDDVVTNDISKKILTDEKIREYGKTFLDIQMHYGYPCDIEFAIENGILYVLQARKITSIKYMSFKYTWSTADFKDGGVSATVCTPYMWSLYEYIWEHTLRKFMIDAKTLKDEQIPKKLGEMFYGRCYWNMNAVKKAMSQIVGYKEREFDSEYGVKMNYEGDGEVTKANLKTIFHIIQMAIAQVKILNERNKNAQKYKDELLAKYEDYKDKYENFYAKPESQSFKLELEKEKLEKANSGQEIQNSKSTNLEQKNPNNEIQSVWYNLTKNDYMQSESTYFWQIFINTVHQSIYKDSLLKYVSESEYLSLLASIDNISHLLPFYEMWDVTRKIREIEDAKNYWLNTSVQELVRALECFKTKEISKTTTQQNDYEFSSVQKIIDKYGYHSDKELDVTYPCYYEDITPLVVSIKDMVNLDDSFSPKADKEKGIETFEKIFDNLNQKIGAKKTKKIRTKVEKMRKMLWWREEFRDISTRFYYIIRIYTVEYAKYLLQSNVIEDINDIWFLKVGNLWDYIDKKISVDDLRKIIAINKKYYNSYRNYMSENEIGSAFNGNELNESKANSFKTTKKSNSKISSVDGKLNKLIKNNKSIKSYDTTSQNLNVATSTIKGLGANSGVVIGTARVIEDFSQIDRLKENDILVTKFTDTGWTPKFAILSGIVTEYGGILCHAAIVSREYGIPAIVNCHDVMSKIKDGMKIKINGATGIVEILK